MTNHHSPFKKTFLEHLCGHTGSWLRHTEYLIFIAGMAHGIFSRSMQTLSCNMWGLVLWPGIKSRPPALGVWSLSHWPPGEKAFKWIVFFSFNSQQAWLSGPSHASSIYPLCQDHQQGQGAPTDGGEVPACLLSVSKTLTLQGGELEHQLRSQGRSKFVNNKNLPNIKISNSV